METIIRATALYWFLWVIIRGVGKRELAEMSAFELILLVTIGDLVQQGVTQEDFSMTGAALSVGTIAAWVLVMSLVTFKSKRVRRVLDGVPSVVVKDGEVVDEVLRIERVSRDEVDEAAREQGIADLAQVRVALLEPDGKFSFITVDGDQHEEANEENLKG